MFGSPFTCVMVVTTCGNVCSRVKFLLSLSRVYKLLPAYAYSTEPFGSKCTPVIDAGAPGKELLHGRRRLKPIVPVICPDEAFVVPSDRVQRIQGIDRACFPVTASFEIPASFRFRYRQRSGADAIVLGRAVGVTVVRGAAAADVQVIEENRSQSPVQEIPRIARLRTILSRGSEPAIVPVNTRVGGGPV